MKKSMDIHTLQKLKKKSINVLEGEDASSEEGKNEENDNTTVRRLKLSDIK
jgi:hypothetical protein